MKNIFVYIVSLLLFSACKEAKKRQVVAVSERTHEWSFTNQKNQTVGEIEFTDKGAGFLGVDFPAYITIDSLLVNDSRHRNISMWLKFDGEDARVPQMVFSVQDTLNAKNRFNLWIAGRRVTAVLNSNHLWAKEYDYSMGAGKIYYDSYMLERGKYYFLSVNYSPNEVEVYINAEKYQQFENIENGDINFHRIYLGAEMHGDDFRNPFFGHLKNLTVFNRKLTENEIYSLSAESYDEISEYNKAFELSKFNL